MRLAVKVQTRASETCASGFMADGTAKVRLKAQPVGGAANRELIRFLSSLFGLPRSAVRIVGGEKSTRKLVQIEGIDETQARGLLASAGKA